MTAYITISYRNHRSKPVYAKVVSSPERIRRIINWAVNNLDGRCYHSRGKYLKLFACSDCPIEIMYFFESIARGDEYNGEISDSDVAEL